jgi:hypothetical protein
MSMKILMAVGCLATLLLSQPTLAQSDLAEANKATVLFDFRVNMIRDGKFIKSIGITEEDQKNLQESSDNDIDITAVERVFGAMTLPESVQDFAMMQDPSNDLPLDFFVQIKFKDASSAKEAFDKMSSDAVTEEIDGKTYIRPPEAPSNIIGQMYDDTTLEIGTKSYILQKDRGREIFTDGLNKAWSQAPNHAIRIAIDLDAERDLVNEAVDMAKMQSNGDPTTAAYLGLLEKTNDIRISLDLDSEVLFELGTTAGDSDKAAEVKEGLDSMLTMAKMMGPMAASQIPDEGVKKLVTEIVGSLEATQDGDNVRISIPRPDGFSEAVKKAVDQAKSMFMQSPSGDSGN